MFVTAWLGILELSTGLLTTASAGHEYPAICRADGQFEFFKDRHGFVLGGMSGSRYKEETLTLLPGDTLFVYTDGVTEATDMSLHLFGAERLLETLNQTPNAAPTDLLNNMSAAIYNFANGMEQADDITMLALRYFGQQNHLRTLRIDATKENLTEVSAWIEEMLQILDVPMKEQMQIQLAAEEIYINIANYAYAPAPAPSSSGSDTTWTATRSRWLSWTTACRTIRSPRKTRTPPSPRKNVRSADSASSSSRRRWTMSIMSAPTTRTS